MQISPLVDNLISSLRYLPGVGPKSAQRMALYLLEKNREAANLIAHSIKEAVENVKKCSLCRNLTEEEICSICADSSRDSSIICVLENPADLFAIESSSTFKGLYFVLYGKISPLAGIGPEDLGLDFLFKKLQNPYVKEVILATNPTVEGETTAHYIHQKILPLNLKVTRLAQGMPLGGELEHTDGLTLARAISSRKDFLYD